MSKRGASGVEQVVKLIIGAGKATAGPPIGPALGSRGVKAIDFVKEFNARTAHIQPGTPMPVRVTVRPDRSFAFDIRSPQTSWFLLNACDAPMRGGRRRGASNPGTETIGSVSLKHIYEIAKIKRSELRLAGYSHEGMCRAVIFQAKSMGIEVVP